MNQAERRGREQFAFLALAGGGLDELGGIPFAEKDLEPLQFQPALEQINLRGFAGAIEPFDGDEPAGKPNWANDLFILCWRQSYKTVH